MPAAVRRYWLMKSEPDAFSFDDLRAAAKRTTSWDGVRNYQARNLMRDQMKVGDGVLYYHSNANPPGIVGIAAVVREAHPDPTQFDSADGHYDPKSSPDAPRWLMVDIQAVKALPRLLSLSELRESGKLEGMALLQRGQRLSVQPVLPAEWRTVLRMAGIKDPLKS